MLRSILITFVLVSFSNLGFSQTVSEKPFNSSSVSGKNGVVTSRSAIASQVGIDILKQGGNAIDAAVATGFALAVTYPSAGNLGGGGFAVVRLANNKVITLDSRERAPSAAHRDMYLDEEDNIISGLSTRTRKATGVPGSVDGLLLLLETYGTMDRHQVLAPAIELAEKGFPLNDDLASQFSRVLGRMKDYPASLAKFSQDGKLYNPGDIWQQPDLAKTLRAIDQQGRDGFYSGDVAKKIVAEMNRGAGIITEKDLENYKSVWRDPVHGTYRGHDIWSMSPPSSGALIIQMLNFLEPYDINKMGWGNADTIHLMIEAERRAYADRAQHFGDPDFHQVPLNMLTSKDYARLRFQDYDPKKASISSEIGAGNLPQESPQTTHFSVMDNKGNIVALTTTLNSSYGNKIVAAGTGVLLNNEMDDFSAKENVANQFGLLGKSANAIEPGKRMLSSMSPTIVTKDNKPFLVTGSPGGSTIITTVFQVIINTIDHQMTVGDAVASPRFHHQWMPDAIWHGPNAISPEAKSALEEMGHTGISGRFRGGIGDANSITYDAKTKTIHGTKDPRNVGGAFAY